MIKLVSTRFTNATLKENRDYREKHGMSGCIYGAPQEFSPKILYNEVVFVIEMNNTLNKIEGIGLIRNKPIMDKYYNIYADGNYNRYIYKSDYFIEREIVARHCPLVVEALDYVLFKEKTHLKRGSGFTTIPEKLMAHRVCERIKILHEIKELFVFQFGKTGLSYCENKETLQENNAKYKNKSEEVSVVKMVENNL
jgi:hypothetical protein